MIYYATLELTQNAKYILAMPPRIQPFLANIGAIGLIVGTILVLTHPQWVGFEQSIKVNGKTEAPANIIATSIVTVKSPSTSAQLPAPAHSKKIANTPPKSAAVAQQVSAIPPLSSPESATTSNTLQVARVPNPYPFPPQSFEVINNQARLALVNILCGARSGTFRPISASGVIIDPRGVILTNAHVAQYFLLSSDPTVDLSCVIRAGSPAYPSWNAEVLFIPPSWVKRHASDIIKTQPVGTGEYDYALLRVTSAINGQPLLPRIAYVPIDTRETIAFKDDDVLVASYPAEFVGGIATQLNLYPATSITTIKKMLTFDNKTVDAISLGGVIGAQSGSSGGAVMNAWGRLVGIISTTSEGETTAKRDLHAITLSYINRNIASESGVDLASILQGDIEGNARAFNASIAPALRKLLIDQITPTGRY